MRKKAFRSVAVIAVAIAVVGVVTSSAFAVQHFPGKHDVHFHGLPVLDGRFFKGQVSSQGPLACTKNRGVSVFYGTASGPGTRSVAPS